MRTVLWHCASPSEFLKWNTSGAALAAFSSEPYPSSRSSCALRTTTYPWMSHCLQDGAQHFLGSVHSLLHFLVFVLLNCSEEFITDICAGRFLYIFVSFLTSVIECFVLKFPIFLHKFHSPDPLGSFIEHIDCYSSQYQCFSDLFLLSVFLPFFFFGFVALTQESQNILDECQDLLVKRICMWFTTE